MLALGAIMMTMIKKLLKKTLKNQNGMSSVATLGMTLLVAAAAASVVEISGNDHKQHTDNMQAVKSLYVGHAGLERSLDRLSQGLSPNVVDMPFDDGKFTVTSDPSLGTITVTSKVGDSKKVQTITADGPHFASKCNELIVDQATIDGKRLQNIQLKKTCNDKSILSAVKVSWNWSDCALDVNCDGSVNINDSDNSNDDVEYEDVGDAPNGKVWICHVPPGNPDNAHTISVSLAGWIHGHKAGKGKKHGMDYLGPCQVESHEEVVEDDDITVTCEGQFEDDNTLTDDCIESDGSAVLEGVTFADQVVFEKYNKPHAEAGPTQSGDMTDTVDAVMSANGIYYMHLDFDKVIPSGAWFTVTAMYADGSELVGIVKAGEQPAPVEEDPVDEDPQDDPADPSGEPEPQVEGNTVTLVESGVQAEFKVLGSEITCGSGGSAINVRAKLCMNNACNELWGYSDLDGGEVHAVTTSQTNTEFKVIANSYLSSCGNFNKTYGSDNVYQVRVLKNGQDVPNLDGYGGQQSVSDYVQDYVSNGKIVLNPNQAIFLFELGTDLNGYAPGSNLPSSADFQDLVVLMTVTSTD